MTQSALRRRAARQNGTYLYNTTSTCGAVVLHCCVESQAVVNMPADLYTVKSIWACFQWGRCRYAGEGDDRRG